MKIQNTAIAIAASLLLSGVMQAQGWEDYHQLSPSSATFNTTQALSVAQTIDGGYIVAGHYSTYVSGGPTFDMQNAYMRKYNAFGEVQWTQHYNNMMFDNAGSVLVLPNGNYALLLNDTLSFADAWGNITQMTTTKGSSLEQTADGGYILSRNADGDLSIMQFVKTNAAGAVQWTNQFDMEDGNTPMMMRENSDGSYIAVGQVRTNGQAGRLHIVKADNTGDTTWTRQYQIIAGGESIAYDVRQTADGGYLVSGYGMSSLAGGNPRELWLLRTNSNGDTLWTKRYAGTGTIYTDNAISLDLTADGGFVLAGQIDGKLYVQKCDANGNMAWERYLGEGLQSGIGNCIRQTTDGGYIVCGQSNNEGATLKLDANGNTYINFIAGNVFADYGGDCGFSGADLVLNGWTVTASNAQHTFSGTTNANGDYFIPVDTGSYTVAVTLSGGVYWQNTCNPSANVSFAGAYDTTVVDFPIGTLASCSILEVDIASWVLRRCVNNTYYVNYCNNGTVTENNGLIFVDLDTNMTYVSATLTPSSVSGNHLMFMLPPLAPGACGSFSITAFLDCGVTVGQTHCTHANSYPNYPCAPVVWNGAMIEVEAECEGDTVAFMLTNTGGNMAAPLQYLVYEDNVMVRPGTFQLNNGETENVYVQANGNTYRIEAQQESGIPAILSDEMVAAVIEGCNAQGSPTTGFVTQFYNYDGSPFYDTDCRPNVASYDPNDKTASPEGYGANHYIYANTDIEYMIRFQNTGNDTAFNVMLVDTLSGFLNPNSIQMGASSHSYTWDVVQEHILRIKFNNIMLPDSNTNEPASNGFVRFRIEQMANNPVGTLIENSAAIYFDFNAPVITNTTFHEIGEDFIVVSSVNTIKDQQQSNVWVFPNPIEQSATWQTEAIYNELRLSLFDALGRQVGEWQTSQSNQLSISRQQWETGVYFYRLEGNGQLLDAGKVVVK